MYLNEDLFAYRCDNNNRCPFREANAKTKTEKATCDRDGLVRKTAVNRMASIGKGNGAVPVVCNEEVMALRNKFPTKVPIIIKRFSKELHLPYLDKSKYLVPQEITMSQFQSIIRNRMRMNSNQALYLLVNNRSMLSLSLTLGEVYSEYAGPDGFLYITYASQEVFGSTAAREMRT